MTRDAFNGSNTTLVDALEESDEGPHRIIVFIDDGVDRTWPDLADRIGAYVTRHADRMRLILDPIVITGGETSKNDWDVFHRVVRAIDEAGICRRSYVIVIGGGAVLDAVGFAAATTHRGVRLVRLPTTTLAQADSGIGVKNGINAGGADIPGASGASGASGGGGGGGKKNFLGTFTPPWAVINDEQFLSTLTDRHWRSGFSETVKVALVKDKAFFEHIESAASSLRQRDESKAIPIIRHSAQLHLHHIVSGGDPFELSASRPLDFGHWAAHKLESMTAYRLTHGEAVAIGMALDVTYASLSGMLDAADAARILNCLKALGFKLADEALQQTDLLFTGLEEFREHLGGRLTIPMLRSIGNQHDVHEIDLDIMLKAVDQLINATSTATA